MPSSIDLDAIWHRAVREAEQSLSLYGEAPHPLCL
jgi:hypothetical protein